MREIRLCLKDVITSKIKEKLLTGLTELQLDRVKFWHNGDVSAKQISEFMSIIDKYEFSETNISITKKAPNHEFAWFDILSEDVNKRLDCSNRFSYIYNGELDILNGLSNFEKVACFVEGNHPGKKIRYDKNKG